MWEKIPQEIKNLKQWVCWAGDKLPKNPLTGKNAQSNNPNTWSDFDTAVKAVDKYLFDGIGFMFANGYFGVDLDNIDDDTKNEFIDTLQSYTEISKSGKGIHIICKGKLPEGRRRKGNVEMYDTGRYFITTGNAIGNYEITDCTEKIIPLHNKFLGEEKNKVNTVLDEPIKLEDEEVIQKARNSKNGMLFQLLYSGNWEQFYPSQSEADMSFCNMLAFWTGRNKEQMDRIFRVSNLMRDKWDRRQSGTTYGEITLLNAISKCSVIYNPKGNYLLNKDGEVYEKPKKDYQLNDTGNAERLVDKFYGLIKYNHENKNWVIWNGKIWSPDETSEVKRLADKVAEEMRIEAFLEENLDIQKEMLKNANRVFSSKGKEAMIKEAMHLKGVPVLNSDFDKDKDLFNLQNGILKLKTGELLPHNPSYFISKISSTSLNREPPKRWLQFMNEITNNNQELIKYIQKTIGYSMTGSVVEDCLFFCYGTGQNGKSVFLETINKIMGTYGANTQPETIMIKSQGGGNASGDIARLKSARFVTSVEPNEGVRLNEGLIKQLTGGDVITARFLYGKEFEFYPEFKLWIATNHKPIIRGTDEGIWRRIRLIPFVVRIPDKKKDKYLKQKLLKELDSIAYWCFQGCLLWQKEGLAMPKSVYDATSEYRNEMDIITNFIETCTMPVEGWKEKAIDVYQHYSKWAKLNNEYEMSNTKFGREFSKRYERTRISTGTYYLDVKLTTDTEGYTEKKYFIKNRKGDDLFA
ncbi:MAG: phage/plasmid primase, P4 family [Methanolobus sp.]|nr:phage/plasmid primase, P4 family [Methanolobus sp.]